jgi:hypothetical protein
MHSSLLVLFALLGGAHAFASTPEKGRLSRDSFVFDLDDLDAAASSLCSCNYAGDGECDDGGEGSQHSVCELGSDGSDCADRGTKGCTVPQCAVGEYHKANAQGGFDCVKPGPVCADAGGDGEADGGGNDNCSPRYGSALSCFYDGVACDWEACLDGMSCDGMSMCGGLDPSSGMQRACKPSGLGRYEKAGVYESYTFEPPAKITGKHVFNGLRPYGLETDGTCSLPTAAACKEAYENVDNPEAGSIVHFEEGLWLEMDAGQTFTLIGLKIREIVLKDWEKEPQFTIRGSNGYEASLSSYKEGEYWYFDQSDSAQSTSVAFWNAKDWSYDFQGVTWIMIVVDNIVSYSVDTFEYTACA